MTSKTEIESDFAKEANLGWLAARISSVHLSSQKQTVEPLPTMQWDIDL